MKQNYKVLSYGDNTTIAIYDGKYDYYSCRGIKELPNTGTALKINENLGNIYDLSQLANTLKNYSESQLKDMSVNIEISSDVDGDETVSYEIWFTRLETEEEIKIRQDLINDYHVRELEAVKEKELSFLRNYKVIYDSGVINISQNITNKKNKIVELTRYPVTELYCNIPILDLTKYLNSKEYFDFSIKDSYEDSYVLFASKKETDEEYNNRIVEAKNIRIQDVTEKYPQYVFLKYKYSDFDEFKTKTLPLTKILENIEISYSKRLLPNEKPTV